MFVDIQELQAEFADFLQDDTLPAETNLQRRAEALDFLAFLHDVLRMERRRTALSQTLQQQAEQLQAQLEGVNAELFQRVRTAIATGALRGDSLRRYLEQFTDYNIQNDRIHMSYDGLDVLVDGIFQLKHAPAPSLSPTVEMVHCEETPARVLLDLIDHTTFAPSDVFYDLGSGLGQVVLLIHLLTGIKAKGVEVEPAFCAFAQRQAQELGLTPSKVDFVNSDARTADYSDGNHFFMFTPFRGQLLQTVLAQLQQVARRRSIRLYTFGSCTPHVADLPWLRAVTPDSRHEYKLVIFASLPMAKDSDNRTTA